MDTGVFITFSGNCKQALMFYQACFGGVVHFETFDQVLPGFTEAPVVSGSLVSDHIVIHGSDLVHSEGRKIGNYLSVFLLFKNAGERRVFCRKLVPRTAELPGNDHEAQRLIELTDAFDVSWVLGIE